MKLQSGDKKTGIVLKIENKPTTARKQLNKKIDNQLTFRQNSINEQQFSKSANNFSKNTTKKATKSVAAQNTQRNPQMIKLMISQLQKQLYQKTKAKKTLKSVIQQQHTTTTKKGKLTKSTQLIVIKNAFSATTTANGWRSPQKKFTKKQAVQVSERPVRNVASVTSPKRMPKKKRQQLAEICESSRQQNYKPARKIKPQDSKAKNKQRQNFIFFGDDLVQLNNLSIPLFVLQNNPELNMPIKLSNRLNNIQVDERASFRRLSKSSSFNSTISQQPKDSKQIQRSFIQDQSINEENLYINLLNRNQNKPVVMGKMQVGVGVGVEANLRDGRGKGKGQGGLDYERIIVLNGAVVKLQRWWRARLVMGKVREQRRRLLVAKCSGKMQVKQQGQNVIVNNAVGNTQVSFQEEQNDELYNPSLSEKRIKNTSQSQHDDILKLRENAAQLQYTTHQQILKDLFGKNKITEKQYNQKLQWIEDNLESEVEEINKIKNILNESARKVQNIMKKTKEDILTVRKISEEENQFIQVKDKFYNQNQNTKSEILSAIFGSQRKSQLQTQSKQLVPIQFEKKCKRIKAFPFQQQMTQLVNQDSQQQRRISSQNDKSLGKDLQEDLISPVSQKCKNQYKFDFEDSDEEGNLQEMIFQKQVSQAPSGCAQQTISSDMVPIQAASNFEKLYREYQEQQETKKQIQLRIARQLGVCELGNQLKPQGQVLGINTSIVGVHKFLLNFFKFYLYYHKNDFLKYMNMPYGDAIEVRLAKNKLEDSSVTLKNWTQTTFYTDEDEEIVYGLKNIISEDILEDFYQSYYQQTAADFSQVERTNIQLEKVHNKAIFEAFNVSLNFFRPYYNIGGAPYVWCSSQKSLTFYCIGQQNIQQVYQKTQMKILKTSSHLCGVQIQHPHRNTVKYDKNSCEQKQSSSQQATKQPTTTSPLHILTTLHPTQPQQNTLKYLNNFQQYLLAYTQNFNPTYLSNLQDRLKKKQLTQIQQQNQEWYVNTFEEEKVSVLLNLTEMIQEIIFMQQCEVIRSIEGHRFKGTKLQSGDTFDALEESHYLLA